jgi:hypothetical protein
LSLASQHTTIAGIASLQSQNPGTSYIHEIKALMAKAPEEFKMILTVNGLDSR